MKRWMKSTIIGFALATHLGAPATAATTRYVRPGGTGSGTGAWSNASGDLNAMIQTSAANDVVWVAKGTYLAANAPNGFPDECDLALAPMSRSFDCNDNGIPDECDIASNYSQDIDHNGVPDECEMGLQAAQHSGGKHVGDAVTGVDLPTGDADGPDGDVPMMTRSSNSDAAWSAFYDWAETQCWGLDCETTGSEQFQAMIDKLDELGLSLNLLGQSP